MIREVCDCCGRINPIPFDISIEMWNSVVPSAYYGNLCILCFDMFATERGIAWDVDPHLEFHPVSAATQKSKRPTRWEQE